MLVQNIPHGFVSKLVAKCLENFIGKYVEFDAKVVALGSTGVLCVRVKIDIRRSLKRKKRIMLPKDSISYVNFAYEKLILFCFLCGRLGQRESFCPNRVLQEN